MTVGNAVATANTSARLVAPAEQIAADRITGASPKFDLPQYQRNFASLGTAYRHAAVRSVVRSHPFRDDRTGSLAVGGAKVLERYVDR